MAFVNENITPEDRAKYGLDELDKLYNRMFLPMTGSNQFCIDREIDSYLRLVKRGKLSENEGNILYFSFWNNLTTYLLKFKIESGSHSKASVWRKYNIECIDGESEFKVIFLENPKLSETIKNALVVYSEAGLLSSNEYVFTPVFSF